MTQLSSEEYEAARWRHKTRALWRNNHERPLDEENCPPNLDYKAIEQIADGVEKMILAWSNGEERETIVKPQVVCSGTPSPVTSSGRGGRRQGQVMPTKGPLSEKSFADDSGSNYMCPLQIQEGSGGITAEIAINGNCPAAGMGSAMSQIVRTGTITNKDVHGEKTVTKTAAYWYMEASNATNQGCRETEEKPESSGRIEGFSTTFNKSCFSDKAPEVSHWKKEQEDVGSILRNVTEKAPEGASVDLNYTNDIPQKKSFHHNRRGSRHNGKRRDHGSSHYQELNGDGELVTRKTAPTSNREGTMQSLPRRSRAKVKEEGLEVPSLPRVNTGPLETLFDSIVIDDEVLEKKLAALTTMPPTPLTNPRVLTEDERHKQIQDLQIALLECAMEYEIKTIELKMKLKSLQSTPRHSDPESKSNSDKNAEQQMLYSKNPRESQIVESMKKQIFKLQREKAAVTKDYLSLKQRERQFETQKRNLEDALVRVNRLTKDLVRREDELLESQLMEKQTRVKLQEKEEALAKATSELAAPQDGIEPAKIVALLPSLREWIKSLKKDQSYDPILLKIIDGYYSAGEDMDTTEVEALKPRSTNQTLCSNSQKLVEKVVQSLIKEVQALQRELSKLGCRNLKHKHLLSQGASRGQENKWGRKTIVSGSPPKGAKRFCPS